MMLFLEGAVLCVTPDVRLYGIRKNLSAQEDRTLSSKVTRGESLTLKRQEYMEQNHLHGQWREFRIWNNTQKTKENDVKMILSSLAYI